MAKRKTKSAPPAVCRSVPRATAGDDTAITALGLPAAPLSPEMAAYFAKCDEKLGFVPNVLKAYAFDAAKLARVRCHVQRSDAGAVGLEQARARDDRGRGIVAQSLLLLPGRPWRRGAAALRRSAARRTDGDELSRGAAVEARARHARFRRQAHRRAVAGRGRGSRARCAVPAFPPAISGTSPRSPPSSTCRTGSLPRPTCGRTASITAGAMTYACVECTYLGFGGSRCVLDCRACRRPAWLSRSRREHCQRIASGRASGQAGAEGYPGDVLQRPAVHRATTSNIKFKMTFTADGKMKRAPAGAAAPRARAPGSFRRTASAAPGKAPRKPVSPCVSRRRQQMVGDEGLHHHGDVEQIILGAVDKLTGPNNFMDRGSSAARRSADFPDPRRSATSRTASRGHRA